MKQIKKIAALAMAATLMMSTGVVSQAATAYPNVTLVADTSMKDENGTIEILLQYDSVKAEQFDYGLVYDETKVECTGVHFDEKFLDACEAKEGDITGGVYETKDLGGYVAVGGVYHGAETYTGVIARVSFKVKEGAEDVGSFKIVKDTNGLGETVEEIKEAIKNAEPSTTITPGKIMLGDVTGDQKINTSDALRILRYTLGKASLEGDALKAADVNGDGNVNTSDALRILRYTLGKATIG